MKLPVEVHLDISDTIGELGGLDTSGLKNAKPGEIWIMAWLPEKKHFGMIKLAGKRKIKKK